MEKIDQSQVHEAGSSSWEHVAQELEDAHFFLAARYAVWVWSAKWRCPWSRFSSLLFYLRESQPRMFCPPLNKTIFMCINVQCSHVKFSLHRCAAQQIAMAEHCCLARRLPLFCWRCVWKSPAHQPEWRTWVWDSPKHTLHIRIQLPFLFKNGGKKQISSSIAGAAVVFLL